MGGRGGTREEKWHLFIYFIGNLKYANFKVNIVIHGREGTQCSSVIWGILWWYYALIRRCTLTSLLSINGQVDGFLRSLFLFLKYLTTKDAYVFFFVCVKAYLAWLEAFLLICTEWEHNTDCIYHKKCCETTKWTPHVFTDGKIQRSEEDKLYYKLDNGKQESKQVWDRGHSFPPSSQPVVNGASSAPPVQGYRTQTGTAPPLLPGEHAESQYP